MPLSTPEKKKTHRLRWALVILFVILLTGYIILVNLLVSAALVPSFMEKLDAFQEVTEQSYAQQIHTSDISENRSAALAETRAWLKTARMDKLSRTSRDGYRLVAAEFPAEAETHRWAVLLHGYTGWKEEMYPFALWYHRQGCNVLIPGLRGHEDTIGESVTTLGYYEQYDLFDLLCTAAEQTGIMRFVLHGEGMGANAALLLCGNESYLQKLADRGISIELVVAESACTDLTTLLNWEASRQLSIRGFLGRAAMRMTVSQNLGFNPSEVSMLSAVGRMTIPAVFICGEEAGYIPASWSRALFEACAAEKTLCLVPNAGHAAAWAYGREQYEAAILERIAG